MARPLPASWKPTQFEEVVERPFDTSMGTAKVKTNATFGYLKALGNRQGPHALASEWIGTSLAEWFGLPVAEFAIMNLEGIDCFPLPRKAHTTPGPAFVSREVPGHTWGRSTDELKRLENPEDITRLVVFDNWIRNCDRHPPNLAVRAPNYANVYLGYTDNPEKYRLYAIDHTHCFDCGRDLTEKLSEIGKIRDEGVYGLFPEFRGFIDVSQLPWCKSMLKSISKGIAWQIVEKIPSEWEVTQEAKIAIVELVIQRAGYIADKIENGWGVDWRTPTE